MATNSRIRLVDSEDGRRLRVALAGDSDRVIVAQPGTPNAGVLFDPWVRDALARGLCLVSYDRPGYGGSSPQPGRSIADCVGADQCGAARGGARHDCLGAHGELVGAQGAH